MTSLHRTLLGSTLATLAFGCGGGPVDPMESQVAADGTQAMVASTQSTSLASVVFDNVSVTDPEKAADQLGMPSQLWPSGCATRVRDPDDPDVVHVTFDDCTGPFGLVHLDGEEVVSFDGGPNGALRATITGVNLTANGRPIVHSATADITFSTETTRTVLWQGSWQRTDDLGDTVAHLSDLQIAVDLEAGCLTSNGSAKTSVGVRSVNTTITNYQVCHDPVGAEGCPSGSVVHTGSPSGKVVTVDFNASSVAQVTGPRGETFALDLACTAIGR